MERIAPFSNGLSLIGNWPALNASANSLFPIVLLINFCTTPVLEEGLNINAQNQQMDINDLETL